MFKSLFKSKTRSLLYVLFSYGVALILGFLSYHLFQEQMGILWATLLADLVMTLIIFLFSLIANNSSIYDPYWSVIPVFILILWWMEFDVQINGFTVLMALVVLLWSVRLTLNWAINWRGFSHEDWRYHQFRTQFGPWYWIISLFAIHIFPTIMVFLGLLPIYEGLKSHWTWNTTVLILGFVIAVIAVIIAYLADSDMLKHRKSNDAQKAIHRGVWKISRHPNYLGEIAFWFACFIMALAAFVPIYTSIGFLAMLALFEGYSIPAMEKRLLKSKSNYQIIKDTVPRLFPIKLGFIKRNQSEGTEATS
jgi:steroid 5-alpha reductase family enzyme